MPLLSSQSSTESASHLLELLSTRYPDLRNDLVSSPRLLEALESVSQLTDHSVETIFAALTARELASAQRPVGVLVSRCNELIDVSIETAKGEQAKERAQVQPQTSATQSSPVRRTEVPPPPATQTTAKQTTATQPTATQSTASTQPTAQPAPSQSGAVRATSLPPDRLVVDKRLVKKTEPSGPSLSERRVHAEPSTAPSQAGQQPTTQVATTPHSNPSEPASPALDVLAEETPSKLGTSLKARAERAKQARRATRNDTATIGSIASEINHGSNDQASSQRPSSPVVANSGGTNSGVTNSGVTNSGEVTPNGATQQTPQPQSAQRETVESSVFLPELAKGPGRPIPQQGFRSVLHSVTLGRVNLGPGKRERRDIELFQRITAPIVGARNVVVLGLKGGVGKTTVSLALGHTFAMFRNDRVVALDASPDPSTLNQRIENVGGGSVRELAAKRAGVGSYVDLRQFAAQQSTGLEVLASDRVPQADGTLTPTDFDGAVECLSAYFNLIVTDSGSGTALGSLKTVLKAADQLVIVTAPMIDAGWSAGLLLDWLEANGYSELAADATVVVNHLQPRVHVKSESFDAYFKNRCRNLVRVPWDSTLAAGGLVSIEALNDETRDAFQELAAIVATCPVSARAA